MEIILTQDVEKLGKAGSVIKVKDGYARNFLIPNKLAIPKTSSNIKRLEQESQRKLQEMEKIKKEYQELKEKLAGLSLTIPVLAQEEDKLYASITAQDIAAALKEENYEIDKGSIMLTEPIKALGIYEVEIKLYPEIIAKVKVWIVKK
ncbi:MAG: 50S ribosomal protein L9 [Candidatus Omnitrophica bacterium]|nr:50S ribosomal protein L9 [Candidatus Omnitrophota bacterium]MBU1906298.1 50S ribosomal protein L9 [Candidatus Omnitrophota bacterium]